MFSTVLTFSCNNLAMTIFAYVITVYIFTGTPAPTLMVKALVSTTHFALDRLPLLLKQVCGRRCMPTAERSPGVALRGDSEDSIVHERPFAARPTFP